MAPAKIVALSSFRIALPSGLLTLRAGDVIAQEDFAAPEYDAIWAQDNTDKTLASFWPAPMPLRAAQADAVALRLRGGDAYDESQAIMLRSFVGGIVL